MDLATEKLYTLVSAQASAIDGVTYDLMKPVATSAYLGTMAEMFLKLFNRLTTPSCTIVSGGSAGSIALGFPTLNSGNAGVEGLYHGVPFRFSATGTISGDLGSAVSTTSLTIRKVLVGISMGDISAVTSSIASTAGTLVFVVGSAFGVSYANAASTGGVSAWFNLVPTPRGSAGMIPVGVINVPTSCTGSNGVSATCMTYALREIYGIDLSAIIGTVVQP